MANAVEAASARGAAAVTKSDTTEVSFSALFVGTGGDVAVVTRLGQTVTFSNVPDGTLLPISVVKVLAATDASDIVGLTY